MTPLIDVRSTSEVDDTNHLEFVKHVCVFSGLLNLN